MDFIIRRAVLADYPALAELYDELNNLHSNALPHIFQTLWPTPQSLEYVYAVLKNKKAVFLVAESGREIIGFIQAVIRKAPDTPLHVKREYVYIDDICVKRACRRVSVGKALMGVVEEWARKKGINQIELNVWHFNQQALAFYENIGYQPASHTMYKQIKKGKR